VKQDEIYEVDRSETRVLIVGNRKARGLKALQGVDNHPSFDLFRRAKIILHSEA
jgi:hypothetical protein